MEPNNQHKRVRGLLIIALGLILLICLWHLRGPAAACEYDAVAPWRGTQSDCEAAERIERLRPKEHESMLADDSAPSR